MDELPTSTSVMAGLARASATFDDAVRAVASRPRVDLSGLPQSAATLLLSRAATVEAPFVVVTPDAESARQVATDLSFFFGETEGDAAEGDGSRSVLVFPASDTTPFADVAPDRRAAMERLSTLFHLAHALPFRCLVVPAAGLARRVPPRTELARRSMAVRAEAELDRDKLVRTLSEGGYLRVPVVEDAGTFAVRGAIVDVFPANARFPARIELDDWLVLSIKIFDPEDQRTLRTVPEITLHPAREALMGPSEIAEARLKLRDLCESIDLPTRATKALLEDLESGRLVLGIEGLLPAFYPRLESVFDCVPPSARFAILDPAAVANALQEELDAASADRSAKVHAKAPVFPIDALYLDEAALAIGLTSRPLTVVHRVVMLGAPDADASPLAALESVTAEAVLALGGEDHALLVATLSQHRAGRGKDDALAPLAERMREWLDAGMRVLIAARTRTQAERLASLLRGYEVRSAGVATPFTPELLRTRPPGAIEIVIGAVASGFVLATLGLVLVTEEEIFGTRAHRAKQRKKRAGSSSKPFLEDLRQLVRGDYVVHVDHGIGRYLGLEKKSLGQSQLELLRGALAMQVEVLVVEYAGGDRLFLPVTRLHQIQKYGGAEGQTPKIDRLGGQTFNKTKAKVRKQVQELADELLRLYAQRAATKRPALPPPDRTYAELEATFPFEETADQAKAIEEVLADLENDQPMDRIVCGDVGFGKTEVAIRAAFRVAMSGRQVAVLCPTTVLAQQHLATFSARMRQYPLRIEGLSRFIDAKKEGETLAAMKEGKVDIVVGTHRLLSKDVHFKDLGMLVVDEEQRFGVVHKERVKKLRAEVDVLTLTATPIPRTLQLAVGGLRDLSLIATPPTDRRAVRTFVTRWDDHLIKDALSRELARGGQAFFVYNRIEGLYERAAKLQALVPEARFAVAHGQMGENALETTMSDFVAGKYDVLCATAIIESGLDIPRANTILIDRADSFGLAQLYQLRGRVGRSRERAYCYLITPPASALTEEARARIEALERFSELGAGFQVASLDMELRGAGDVLGAEQSGTVASVGFDLFMRMLEEAVAELRGQPVVRDVETELTLETPLYLPETYVDDVGLRLSFYKRFASADDESEVADIAAELEDRFGPPPPEAMTYVRAMRLRAPLRAYRVLGCEASRERVTLHLREDTPLDPSKVMAKVALKNSPWKLTPDMKLTRRFPVELAGDSLDRIEQLLRELADLRRSA